MEREAIVTNGFYNSCMHLGNIFLVNTSKQTPCFQTRLYMFNMFCVIITKPVKNIFISTQNY